MKIIYPHSISNCLGEKIVFKALTNDSGIDKVMLEAYLEPGCGPAMHTHFRQDESLTVISGEMMYQSGLYRGLFSFSPLQCPERNWQISAGTI